MDPATVFAAALAVKPRKVSHGEAASLPLYVVLDTIGPVVSQTLPLAEGRCAYESGGQTHRSGKTVLVVRSSG